VALLFLSSRLILAATNVPSPPGENMRSVASEFLRYCRPLVFLGVVTFIYDFADKWLLQRFGGSAQQGFFQLGNQFANIMFLVSVSIVNIFWKEIAEAWHRQDRSRVALLYRRVTRGLLIVGALGSGLVLPWSRVLTDALLGPNYQLFWPVLAIMLLYPVHVSLGVIGGSTLLAIGQTRLYAVTAAAGMLLSLPVTFYLLAPSTLGGLAAGAWGLAIKIVLLNILTVNFQAFVVSRYLGWRFDWFFQIYAIVPIIGASFLSKAILTEVFRFLPHGVTHLAVQVLSASALYVVTIGCVVWRLPRLLGFSKAELDASILALRVKFGVLRKV
jgi:O-antigen/teichoic acid export membrane protein